MCDGAALHGGTQNCQIAATSRLINLDVLRPCAGVCHIPLLSHT